MSSYNLCPFVTNEQSCAARQFLDANEIQFRKRAIKNIKIPFSSLFYKICFDYSMHVYVLRKV